MTGPTNTGNEAPRTGSDGPESVQDPEDGTERRPGGEFGPQTGAQSLEAHNAGPSIADCRADDIRWPLEKHGE